MLVALLLPYVCQKGAGTAHLVAVREEVPIAVAANELPKLPFRFHGRHGSIIKRIVLAGTRKVLVCVGDAIRVVVHPGWLWQASLSRVTCPAAAKPGSPDSSMSNLLMSSILFRERFPVPNLCPSKWTCTCATSGRGREGACDALACLEIVKQF